MSDLAPTPQPDLEAAIKRVKTWPSNLIPEEAADLRMVLATLSAEQERADALADILEEAPHDSEECELVLYPEEGLYPDGDSVCSCWKSTVPRAKATS